MGAIPTSDMPGFQQLQNRVYGALDRCQESQAVDFKESSSWDSLKSLVKNPLYGNAELYSQGCDRKGFLRNCE
jgi:hypothetical protein